MKINCKKTQLIMISPPNGYDNKSYITVGSERINSKSDLKLLGFVFGSEPNVSRHVEEIKKKFRSRFWSLIHLRRAGIKGSELLSLFNVFLRPVIEYCSIVYHSMLTAGQSDELERLQKQVIKLAFGWDRNYAAVCAEQDISTLKERRENHLDHFIHKSIQSERFGELWFPRRELATHNIRDRKPFKETKARTARYFNSPLSYMRRRANQLYAEYNETEDLMD